MINLEWILPQQTVSTWNELHCLLIYVVHVLTACSRRIVSYIVLNYLLNPSKVNIYIYVCVYLN
jgi:hypothetical protein